MQKIKEIVCITFLPNSKLCLHGTGTNKRVNPTPKTEVQLIVFIVRKVKYIQNTVQKAP